MKEKRDKKVNRINYLIDEERYEIAVDGGHLFQEESSEFDSDLEDSQENVDENIKPASND